MGMLVNPFSVAGSAPFMAGDNSDAGTNMALGGNQQRGYTWQAVASGTINNLVIEGSSGGAFTDNYRLVIYAATSASVVSGAKLGETAQQTGLGLSEVRVIPLLAPVNIVSGNWYFFSHHGATGAGVCRLSLAGNGRFFNDTYSDGSVDPAPASSNNGSSSPKIWGTS